MDVQKVKQLNTPGKKGLHIQATSSRVMHLMSFIYMLTTLPFLNNVIIHLSDN